MPSNGKRLKGQAQVHEKDSFDYTAPQQRVQGAASAQSAGRPRSADAEAMLRFTTQFQNIQSQATGLFDQRAKELQKEGATSAMKGEARPQTASEAFLEGFETQQGEAAVADYISDREALQAQAANLAPHEYEAQSEAINKKYLLGAPDNFIRGFVPNALKAGAKYDRDYQTVQKNLIDQQYLTDVRKKAYAYTQVVMQDDKVTDKAQAIRGLLTAQQIHGKKVLKADRNMINMEFVETLGAEAIRGGNPDLMAFAAVKDEDGHALIDDPALADKINQTILAAQSKQTTMAAKAVENGKALIKQTKENVEKQIILAMERNQKDPNVLAATETFILNQAHILEPDEVSKYIQRVHTLQLDENWPQKNNANGYRLLYSKAAMGEMTADDWADASYYITRDSYQELARVQANAEKAFGKETGGVTPKEIFNRYRNMAIDNAGANSLLPTFDQNNGAIRAEIITFGMDSRMAEFLSDPAHKLKDINHKLIEGWYKEVMDLAESYAPPVAIPDIGGGAKKPPNPRGTARVAKQAKPSDAEFTSQVDDLINTLD